MIQKILGYLIALATALPFVGTAQAIDTSDIYGLTKYTLQPLNKGFVTSGFLSNQGTMLLSMQRFNGTLTYDNRYNLNLWRIMYVQLQKSYCGNASNPLPDIVTVNNAIENVSGNTEPNSIALLMGNYDELREDALTNNLVTYNSNTKQVHDVRKREESPYNSKQLFAASPVNNSTFTGTETFRFNSNLFYNTTGQSLSSLQINYGNGLGFVTMPLNTNITISYADTGSYTWTIKATLSNNSVLQCYVDYNVFYIAPNARFTPPNIVPPTANALQQIAAVSGVHKGGSISYVLSTKSPNGNNKIRKPLIIVEDMDASASTPTIQRLSFDINNIIDKFKETEPQYDFNQQLDDVAGYDLVFINFNDGMDGIVANAAVVQEAINRINANKELDNRSGVVEQNVVLGIGTGGLNARYALANMAKNFGGSNTRLLITHDSPHKGANIPLGLQHLIKMSSKASVYNVPFGLILPNMAQSEKYLNAQVNKDVLIYKADNDVSNSSNTFLDNVYQPMVTFTSSIQPYKFVATSLGNECARPIFNPGSVFIDYGYMYAYGYKYKLSLAFGFLGVDFSIPLFSITEQEVKIETQISAKSIPTQNGNANIVTKLKNIFKVTLLDGVITLLKIGYDKEAFSASNYLPIDGSAGSFTSTFSEELIVPFRGITGYSFSYDETIWKVKIGKFLKLSYSAYFKGYQYLAVSGITRYTKIPVSSALDISPFNANTLTEKFTNNHNPNFASKSSVYIAQESIIGTQFYNNLNGRFTARNARFMFNEMQGLSNSEYCSSECGNPYIVIGNDLVCNTANYQLLGNIPSNASIAWSVSPSTTASVSPLTGTTTTLTRTGSGAVTLNATIVGGCPNTGGSKSIYVGTPNASDGSITLGENQYFDGDNNVPLQVMYPYLASFNDYNNWGNYTWSLSSNLLAPNGTTGQEISITPLNPAYQYFSIAVQPSNACGLGAGVTISGQTVPLGGGMEFLRLAPNPTIGPIEVSIENNNGKAVANGRDKIKKLFVVNKFGTIFRQFNYGNGQKKAILQLIDLPADVYGIRVYNGSNWMVTKFIKQ